MAIPCRPAGWETSSLSPPGCLAVWVSGNPPGARLLERQPAQQPVTAASRPGPATGSHATPHQDRGGGTGEGGPTLHGVAPRHLRTIHGDGAWRGSRYLKLRRCFINAGLPTLVRIAPLLVPFPFRLRLVAKSPRAATQHATCPSVWSSCLSVSLSSHATDCRVVSCRVASSRPALAHRTASSAATHTGFIYLPPSTCCTPRDIHERHRCFGLSVGRRLSASFPIAAWPGTQPAAAIRLAASKSRGPWYQNFWTRTEITSRESLGRWLASAPSPGVSPGCGRWAAQPCSVLLG